MNSRVLVTLVFFSILNYGTRAQGTKNLPFDCPVECQSSDYKPICSRGISYANLCILKRQICKGDTAPEIYKDIESCPKYDKDDDTNGSSVEAIDKNGVVFRNFFDITNTKKSRPIIRKKVKTYDCPTVRKGNNFIKCPRNPCSNREIGNYPVCILGVEISSFCMVKRLVCQSHLPKRCEKSSSSEESSYEIISSLLERSRTHHDDI